MARLILLVFLFLACGCRDVENTERVALKVGDIEVTKAEFDESFKASPYGAQDTKENRKKFLEAYALRMTLLSQAEQGSVDRDPRFLKDIEFFWQQALIKRLFEIKANEAAAAVVVSDAAVQNYFVRNRDNYFRGKNFADCAPAIKSFLIFQEENRAVDAWVQSLKSKTRLRVNKSLVGLQ